MPLALGAGTTVDLGQFSDSQPVPPEKPPLLEKLLELRRSLIEGPESPFPAPPGYRLPWLAGISHSVAQGPNEGPTHRSLHAWDFRLKYELVLAARGGRVSMVRASERVGGCDSAYGGSANYILIDHGDGTSALYLHIDYQGALVKEGALVAQGRAIAYSGSSGLSCGGRGRAGPHLHFQVQRTVPGKWWSRTIPIVFDELDGDTLVAGKGYESGNLPSDLMSVALSSSLLRRPARGTETLVSPSRSFLSQASGLARTPTATPLPPTPVPPAASPVLPTPTRDGTAWARFKVVVLSPYFKSLCSGFSGGCQLLVCSPTGDCRSAAASARALSEGWAPFPLPAGEYTITFSERYGSSEIKCRGSLTVPLDNYVEIVTTDSPTCFVTIATRH